MSPNGWLERQKLAAVFWKLLALHGIRAIEVWRLHFLFPSLLQKLGWEGLEIAERDGRGRYHRLERFLLEEGELGLISYDGQVVYFLGSRNEAYERISSLAGTEQLVGVAEAVRSFYKAYRRSFLQIAA